MAEAAAEVAGRDEVVVAGLGGTAVEAGARAGIVVAAPAGIVAAGLDGTVVGAPALVEAPGLGDTPEAAELAACRVGVVAWIEAGARVWIAAVPDGVVDWVCIGAAQDAAVDWVCIEAARDAVVAVGLGGPRVELVAWVGFADGCSVRLDAPQVDLGVWVGFADGCSVRLDAPQVGLAVWVGSAGVRWVGLAVFRVGRDALRVLRVGRIRVQQVG